MRRILLLLLLAAPAPAAAQDPVFLVRAVNEENGRALRDILIQVRDADTDLVRAEARTDREGRAPLTVAPLQWYTVRAIAPGFTSRDEVLMAPARGTTAFPVALEPIPPRLPQFKYGTVSGRVLGAGGAPLDGIIVFADPTHSMSMGGGRTTTAKDGGFRFDLPAGTYRIRTEHSNPFPKFNTVPPVFDVYGRAEAPPVVVAPDRETPGVVIEPPREQRFRARVTVVGEAGPVSEGRVEWRGPEGRGFSARIQPDGTADLGPLERGHFTLTAVAGRKPAQSAGTAEIEIVDGPLDGVVITAAPAGRARGRILGPDGRPFRPRPGQSVWVTPNAAGSLSTWAPERVEVDGYFFVPGLIGDMCLRATGDGLHTASVTHQEIDYTGHAFRFEPGQEIAGIVIRLAPGSVTYPDDRRCER
jgi:hypothetical protein